MTRRPRSSPTGERDADRRGTRRRARPDARQRRGVGAGARPVGALDRAAGPDPVAARGRAAADDGLQLQSAKAQRELVARLAEHEIGGLGFGTGFAHKRLPPALADEARKRDFPLFEVPYELPFIAITERVFAQLLDERYEMLQRSMAGDVLAEALTGRLYPEELQARLRPFGIGERAAVLAFAPPDPGDGRPAGRTDARARGELDRPEQAKPPASDRRRRQPRGDPQPACCARWWTTPPAGRRARAPDRARPDRACAPDPRRAHARLGGGGAGERQPRGPDAVAARQLPRGALRAGGDAPAERQRRGGGRPPTPTSAPSSCCCPCRTTTRC